MKDQKAFTMIELVIVVAVAGIVAAIALPALMRARVAANESATLGDIRTIISAQTAYRSANSGYYDSKLSCLTAPSSGQCIPSYPLAAPTFLDSQLASQLAKAGYNRFFTSGPIIATVPTASMTSTPYYRYDATPTTVGVTGQRGFAGEYTGRLCFTPDGSRVPSNPFPPLPPNCQDIR